MKAKLNSQEKIDKKKRLGQFFTDSKLAKLLSALSVEPEYISIFDPMCGKADMLTAASLFNNKAQLVGVDIDEGAIEKAEQNFCENNVTNIQNLYNSNIFSKTILDKLPFIQYDLVITNPPYVRYQSLNNDNESRLPSAEEIRAALLDIINNFQNLDINDKKIYSELVKGYSGLSDLAVPSWILCSMLTKENGRLAMVVPESWLNREYAYPIHYLLLKYFDIEYVIEDVDRSWFKEALIKTNLVIAKKKARVENLYKEVRNKTYVHVGIKQAHGNESSLVGNIIPGLVLHEHQFKRELQLKLDKYMKNGLCKRVNIINLYDSLVENAKETRWYKNIEGNASGKLKNNKGNLMPTTLKELLAKNKTEFITLEELGVQIGQGLRTGANKFFYVELEEELGNMSLIKLDQIFDSKVIEVPSSVLLPVIRKQNELPLGYTVNSELTKGRVIWLENFIHPKDYTKLNGLNVQSKIMNAALSDYVSKAETMNIGMTGSEKYIPYLSAVKTNVTKMKNNDPNTIRYWYMLPKLSYRHKPELFVPRINNLSPKFLLNDTLPLVIDANFSTIWTTDNSLVNKFTLIALLNSDWFILVCELLGSIMGGGALKLEATHLKKALLPKFSINNYLELTNLGIRLSTGDTSAKTQIDQIFAETIMPENQTVFIKEIRKLTMNKQADRIGK
ncbi:N-6 DNA methylase [Paenibacillus xylanexedens]|uniref:N-6 DNA methylase n=1 Tax=Paenibacillus xylanexedens TaxID=528191 RepID=UPI0011A0F4CB|nr:N-6 DNA methylase [Paenibacillus xylanexedens]